MKQWGIDKRISRNKGILCQRERCLRNIWKFQNHPLGESWTGESSRETRDGTRRKGQSGCIPMEGSRKIRRICGSHRKQGGNWSRWISGILLPLPRRHRRRWRRRRRRLRAPFSRLVSKVVSYLFMNYATRALPHQRQTICAKYTREETFHPPPRKSDVILG